MKKRIFEISCPHCHHSFFMARDTYLIKEPKSVEYDRMVQGIYFYHQCQHCHQLFELQTPLLYRDPELGFSLLLNDQPPVSPSSFTLWVKDTSQFNDAFSILNRSLSLKKTLPVLMYARRLLSDRAKIESYDAEKRILWIEDHGSRHGQQCEEDLFEPLKQ